MEQKYHDKYFTKKEIINRFRIFDGDKTLGEIDFRGVFYTQVPAKGIAGCVIEQSVLNMKQNSMQEADLEITDEDGHTNSTELKVTGVLPSNKDGCKYEAKEPMSLTAVSIGTIENENFFESHYYNKIAHMLWVFYLYDKKEGQSTVPYIEYTRFPVLGYEFIDIVNDSDELERFKNDWTLARDYIIEANKTDNPEELYPHLHEAIKSRLFYVDIAPRYKTSPYQRPRFRFKKSYVDTIFQQFYQKKIGSLKKFEKLEENYNSYDDLETALHNLTAKYQGKTVEELIRILKVPVQDINHLSKSVTEAIMVRMLGGQSRKISNIEVFSKIGVIAKTIVVTTTGGRTEDMKLFTMDLDEIKNLELPFEETSYYEYFNNHQILCILFEEPSTNAKLNENRFLGFKFLSFTEDIINETIKTVYEDICYKINNGQVIESYMYKNNGTQRINKTGVPMVTLNFPKSAEFNIFVRGTSSDSTRKPWTFNGQSADGSDTIHAYSQQIWIRGKYVTDLLSLSTGIKDALNI